MPNGAHRRKRRRRGSGRPQCSAGGPVTVKHQRLVQVPWRAIPASEWDRWAEIHEAVGVPLAQGAAAVLVADAIDAHTGESYGTLAAWLTADTDPESYFADVALPTIAARLDDVIGPHYWRRVA